MDISLYVFLFALGWRARTGHSSRHCVSKGKHEVKCLSLVQGLKKPVGPGFYRNQGGLVGGSDAHKINLSSVAPSL